MQEARHQSPARASHDRFGDEALGSVATAPGRVGPGATVPPSPERRQPLHSERSSEVQVIALAG